MLKNFRELSEMAQGRRCTPPPVRVQPDAKPRARCTLHFRHLAQFARSEAVFSRHFAGSEGAYWLHSAALCDGMSRFSFIGGLLGPLSYLVAYRSTERRLPNHAMAVRVCLRRASSSFWRTKPSDIAAKTPACHSISREDSSATSDMN